MWNMNDRVTSVTIANLERFLGALMGRGVEVLSSSSVAVAASHVGKTPKVFISPRLLNPRSKQEFYSTYGAALHELGHLLHSPDQDDTVLQAASDKGLFTTWNMAEDPKIELAVLRDLPGARKYIQHTVLMEILRDPMLALGQMGAPKAFPDNSGSHPIDGVYPLTAGRTYLPAKLRSLIRETTVSVYSEEAVVEFESAYDDLHATPRLAEPLKYLEALDRLRKAAEALGSMQMVSPPTECGGGRSHDPRTPVREEDGEVPRLTNTPSDEDPGKEGTEEDADQRGAGRGLGDDEKEGRSRSLKDLESDLSAALGELMKDIESSLDKEHSEDWEVYRTEAYGAGSLRSPKTDELSLRRTVVEEFEKLSVQAKAGVDRRVKKGRVNVARVARTKDRLGWERKAFDRFRPNKDNALDVSIQLLVDTSGSVGSDIRELEGVLWSVATGVGAIRGPRVRIMTFNSFHKTVKTDTDVWNPRYVPTFAATGGTDPLKALEEIRGDMSEDRARTRLLFILTDGVWNQPHSCGNVIRKMTEEGVEVHLIGFGGFVASNNNYPVTGHTSGSLEMIQQYIIEWVKKTVISGL